MLSHHKYIVAAFGCAALLGAPVLLQGAALSKTDARFMKMAAVTNMTEAHLGQMAEAQGAEQGVKDFGQKLSDDQTKAYEGLTEIANKTGERIPKAIGHEATIAQLANLKGNRFDRAFLLDEVHAHRTAIAEFRNEARHGENADVKTWAQNMIPTLESHLQTAESLEKHERK
jgi:putative membrane protein